LKRNFSDIGQTGKRRLEVGERCTVTHKFCPARPHTKVYFFLNGIIEIAYASKIYIWKLFPEYLL